MNTQFESNDPEIFNYASFRRRMLNDNEIIVKLISGVIDKMPGMLDLLHNLIERGETAKAGRQAHMIKGLAANLGGESLRKAALSIELAAESDGTDTIKSLFPDLEKEWKRLEPFLNNAIT